MPSFFSCAWGGNFRQVFIQGLSFAPLYACPALAGVKQKWKSYYVAINPTLTANFCLWQSKVSNTYGVRLPQPCFVKNWASGLPFLVAGIIC